MQTNPLRMFNHRIINAIPTQTPPMRARINSVIFHELGGTITFFCKKCGEKVHLVFDRTMMDIELKRPTQKEAYARA